MSDAFTSKKSVVIEVIVCVYGLRTEIYYESRSRAAYWDGKNALGESVSSGVYFYTLTAGNFKATRRMLILKYRDFLRTFDYAFHPVFDFRFPFSIAKNLKNLSTVSRTFVNF